MGITPHLNVKALSGEFFNSLNYGIMGSIMQIQLLTKDEKAKELGISYRALSEWIRLGKIDWYITRGKRKWFMPKLSSTE